MPPYWPRKPDRKNDVAFRRFGDRVNLAFNIAIFATVTSSLWFFLLLQSRDWPWLQGLTLGWLALIVLQGIYVMVIADYSNADDTKPIFKKDKPEEKEESEA
ncbi:MAG: hypothetical protein HC790_04600 [Acaryochloridaceae cyanobacterium CSU_3_4]|nr:hypothetical protein [Acaryochloris sp. SU_5_25]NJN38166.1 hypothetical protein [Acaryochloridaceae cyanobacterium CSU_3_4]